MERGKLPEIPVPAWPQTATARLTNHPLSNREFLEVPLSRTPPSVISRTRASALQLAAAGAVAHSVSVSTTIIAAERQNRRCFAVEISPAYCDVVVERWETYTGKTAERLTA